MIKLFTKRNKVKAKYGGRVCAVRKGDRTRVSVLTPKGESEYYFVKQCKVKEGQELTPNATLGWA